ncbi:MAG: hypothetical protein ACKVU4_11520 [Phycisphaerales bacterium]
MPRTVLLRHDLPDGSAHYDWMIQRPGGPGATLVAFRVTERIDAGVAAFVAERIGDHRAAYLDYEGEVSGGRGRVTRVAEGEVEIVADEPARFAAAGSIGAARGAFEGRITPDGSWAFVFTRGR